MELTPSASPTFPSALRFYWHPVAGRFDTRPLMQRRQQKSCVTSPAVSSFFRYPSCVALNNTRCLFSHQVFPFLPSPTDVCQVVNLFSLLILASGFPPPPLPSASLSLPGDMRCVRSPTRRSVSACLFSSLSPAPPSLPPLSGLLHAALLHAALLPPRQTIEETHASYNAAVTLVLEHMAAGSRAEVMMATHNQASIEHAIALMQKLGIRRQDGVSFGQLLGMADNITFPLGAGGYKVRRGYQECS